MSAATDPTSLWADPRVRRGLQRQLERRAQLVAAGARALGWKAGFGTPAAMAAIGTSAPLVAFMTDRTLLADGAEVAVGGWTAPRVEIELAVRLGADVPGGADLATAGAAIAALAPAIELVDLDRPHGPDDVEDVLADGIFHRHVVLGTFDERRAGGDTDGIRVSCEGEAPGATVADVDPVAASGPPAAVVRGLADVLADAGVGLRAGDVVITGAVTPPFEALSGTAVAARFAGLGTVSVRFAP